MEHAGETKDEVLDWVGARDVLRTYRETNIRKSRKVVDLWDQVIYENVNKLGDEKYVVLEQVFIAAVDSHRMDVANECLQHLVSKFKNSRRVRLLNCLMLEALERYDEALQLLDSLMKDDETNGALYKRKIAILKSQGKYLDAIKELTEYLQKFMIDQEAWNELCNLYLNEQEYGKAVFCMEELILLNPHNHLYYQRFAEIKYTQGGYENFDLSFQYYYHALKLCPSNMRSLFGLYLSAKHAKESPKCPIEKKSKMSKAVTELLKQIESLYLKASKKKYDPEELEDMFGSLCLVDFD